LGRVNLGVVRLVTGMKKLLLVFTVEPGPKTENPAGPPH
jgi:hypothetical protein